MKEDIYAACHTHIDHDDRSMSMQYTMEMFIVIFFF